MYVGISPYVTINQTHLHNNISYALTDSFEIVHGASLP